MGRRQQHFILYSNLHLNMTFNYIYFSANTFLKCYFARLRVLSFVHNTNKNPYSFTYCGIVPFFTLYPSSNKVTISVEVELYLVSFESIISYSVIGSHQIRSYQVKSKNMVLPIEVLRFFIPELYFLRYELQVERYEILHISCNKSEYSFIKVHDGPGMLDNILEPIVSEGDILLYTTTTFQSVITLITKKIGLLDTTFLMYNTTMSRNKHKTIYPQKNHSILVMSENKLIDTEVHMIKIETLTKLYLNVTIHQMNYIGKNHSSCGFAGLTSYDIYTNGTFEKISTVCHSNNYQEYTYRSIYTQNSEMLLVLYSYKQYSKFNLTLSVSTSQCKATTINICEFEHDPFHLESNIFFLVNNQKCVVLQLNYGQGNMSLLTTSSKMKGKY